MADEQLIYRITRAVYDKLGTSVDERAVSELVMEIYQAVDATTLSKTASSPSSKSASRDDASTMTDAPRDIRLNMPDARSTAGGVAPQDTQASSRLVVSVFGTDRPGIVARVAQMLADEDCSIVDINQTVVQGKFAMLMIADMSRSNASAADIKQRFRDEGDRTGIRIYVQREDLFHAMHRV